MKLLDYHHLDAAEIEARNLAALEATVRAERTDFPEHVDSLLPPPEERYANRQGWPRYPAMKALCELYRTATPAQREFIRSTINWNRARQLALFRLEATETAVRTNSTELLHLALVSLAISSFAIGDARDVILKVDSLVIASRKIGADWSALVDRVAAISGSGIEALLRDSVQNRPR